MISAGNLELSLMDFQGNLGWLPISKRVLKDNHYPGNRGDPGDFITFLSNITIIWYNDKENSEVWGRNSSAKEQ